MTLPTATTTATIRYEQAVYGSFAFWDRGYAMLAHSPGCRAEWLAALRDACQRHGERPPGAAEAGSLFALPLEHGPWAIVGVRPQGRDDRGRPGALAFHALFVSPRDYRRAGSHPFAFAHLHRDDWDSSIETLAPGLSPIPLVEPDLAADDPRASTIARALARGHRVALESPAPIDGLARRVWDRLPADARGRLSLATWAFANGNRFDLVALPRLAGIALDPSYRPLDALESESEGPADDPSDRPAAHHVRALPLIAVVAAILAVAGIALGLRGRGDRPSVPEPQTVPTARPGDPPPPDRSLYPAGPVDPDERIRVADGLATLARRFGVLRDESPLDPEPVALMVLLAERLRYRGPLLTAREQAALAAGRDHDAALALSWHAQVRRFADDRPLPPRFAAGPLRWQLDTLAWSFHLDDDPDAPRRPVAEVPHALDDALAVDVALPPMPLLGRHPTLRSYRAFLSDLPRR